MSLKDRFRIDELTSVGSKSITRDKDGGITLRRVNNQETKPSSNSDKPFGTEPIKSKSDTSILKSDTVNPTNGTNPLQESFSGETSTFIEKPIYNEEEIQKAVDVKVDELIKEKKPKRGQFVRKDRYDAKLNEIQELNNQIKSLQSDKSNLQSRVSQLESEVESLQSRIESIQEELNVKDVSFNNLLERYNILLSDLQTAITKGTKEAVERASVTAQVKGLQAQKTSLTAQLNAQRGINDTLKTQIEQQAISFDGIITSLQSQADNLQATIQNQAGQITSTQESLAAAQAEASRAQAESASKGKKIICNELYKQGYLTEDIWIADEKFGDWLWETNRKTAIGYTIWARKVVRFMQQKPQYTKYIYKFLKPWTLQMAYQMGVVEKTNLLGWLTMKIGWKFSDVIYTIYGNKFEKVLTRLNRIN